MILLISISPGGIEIFNRMIEKDGTKNEQRLIDYRRTDQW
jgi:hypothetical protein